MMKCFRRVTAIMMSILLILGVEAVAAATSPDTGFQSISYVDAQGAAKTAENCLPVAENMSEGWYAVTEDKEFGGAVEISGAVNLILGDGKTLKANGIHVPDGASLTIWAQSVYTESSNTGKLLSVGSNGLAGIGPKNGQRGGTVVINGGNIDCQINSSNSAVSPAIGGSSITINGGKVRGWASFGAGIGSGYNGLCGVITINGGEVYGESGEGAGIGMGNSGVTSGQVTINGGTVTAKSHSTAAGIGGGYKNYLNSITITGGTVTAMSNVDGENQYELEGAGIGGGSGGGSGTITISGGNVTATCNGRGAGIGAGYEADSNNITITGNATVTATCVGFGAASGAGIGAGANGNASGTITISGNAKVTATSKGGGAGIGAGWSSGKKGNLTGSVIIKENATVTARGGGGGAGIGAGDAGNARDGHIHISGNAHVYAYGSKYAAGIGGGEEYHTMGGEGCGDVKIEGKVTVFAQSGEGSCSAIGHGDNDSYMGSITFGRGLCVKAGNELDDINGTYERLFTEGEREAACQWRHKALIQPCDHPGEIHYVYIGADGHLRDTCSSCGQVFMEEPHVFDDATHKCTSCGYEYGGALVTISFDANGGSGTMENLSYMPEGIYIPPACGFTPPEGKIFRGWLVSATGTGAEDPVGGLHLPGEAVLLPGGGDVVFKAQWEGDTTMTFSSGEGGTGEMEAVHPSKGEKYPLPTPDAFTAPEWYSFAGWQINDDAENLKQPLETITIAGDTVITAIWTRESRTVTFDTDGGSDVPAQTPQNGETVTKPDDPTREGYSFLGWYLEDEEYDFTTPVTKDLTLTARWKQVIYTVTFTDGLGNELDTQEVAEGSAATAPADPERDGYTFDGWDTGFSHVTSDLTVTARWKQVIVTYTVTFEDGLGYVLETQTVIEGRPAAAPANPTRDGFVFSDWDTDFSCVTADLTVKARWTEAPQEEDKFTVVFVFGFGRDPAAQVVSAGEAATAPDIPEVDGFTFTGWDQEFSQVTENMTVTAGWKKNTAENQHTVVFVDGFSVNPLLIQRVRDGQAAKPPEDPARKRYIFKGWDTDFSYVTTDLTVIAQWEQNIAVMTRAPAANEPVYNGKAQELVTAGTATGGTMQYALGTDLTTAPADGWSATIPTGTDAGTYYVWYKAAGDQDHADTDAAGQTVTIHRASIANATVTLSATYLDYTGGEQSVTVTEVKIGGTKLTAGTDYEVTSGTTGTDKGYYTVKVTGKGNYQKSVTAQWIIGLVKPDISAAPTASEITYGQKLDNSTLSGGAAKNGEAAVEGTFAWKNPGVVPAVSDSEKTEYTVVFTPKDTGNYMTAECKVKLKVNKESSVPAAMITNDRVWDGTEEPLVTVVGSPLGGTMWYAIGTADAAPEFDGASESTDRKWSTAVPKAADAGTYTVWYLVKGDENHNDTVAGKISVTIQPEQETVPEQENVPEQEIVSGQETVPEQETPSGQETVPGQETTEETDPAAAQEAADTEAANTAAAEAAAAQEAADTEAANTAAAAINALPAAGAIQVSDRESIEAALAIYAALTEAQKAKVPAEILQKLTDAQAALAAATEAEKVYTVKVTVSKKKAGTATADVTSGKSGTKVKLTAKAKDGYRFKEWKVLSGGVTIANNRFAIGNANVKVRAVFEKLVKKITVGGLKYTLNLKKGTATVTGAAKTGVKKITIPETVKANGTKYKVTAIGAGAFAGLKKLESVTIGKNVNTIGKKAFSECRKLQTIVIRTKALTEKNIGKGAFAGTKKDAKYTCPKGKKKEYQKILKKRGASGTFAEAKK